MTTKEQTNTGAKATAANDMSIDERFKVIIDAYMRAERESTQASVNEVAEVLGGELSALEKKLEEATKRIDNLVNEAQARGEAAKEESKATLLPTKRDASFSAAGVVAGVAVTLTAQFGYRKYQGYRGASASVEPPAV